MPSVEHRSHKGLNRRAENSRQPTRKRGRARKGFRSPVAAGSRQPNSSGRVQPDLTALPPPRRHLLIAPEDRTEMSHRLTAGNEITGTTAVPTVV